MATTGTAAAPDTEWSEFKLDPESEFRVEVDLSSTAAFEVVRGSAEVFGSEVATRAEVQLRAGSKAAVFSWTGAVVRVKGSRAAEYCAGDTPMPSYLNVHVALENVRRDAAAFSTSSNPLSGPSVMIVGPSDVGKSSIAKILANYAIKHHHPITFASLDCADPPLALPGSLTATIISRPIDIEEGLSGTPSSTGIQPLVYYYGYIDPNEKLKLYQKQVSLLAATVQSKLASDPALRTAGVLIDTPSQFTENPALLSHAIEVWKPSVILVVGHERVYSDLARQFQGSRDVSVLKLAKSGGVRIYEYKERVRVTVTIESSDGTDAAKTDMTYTRSCISRQGVPTRTSISQNPRIFYGTTKFPLSPFSNIVSFNELAVRRVGDATTILASALPIGQDRKTQETKIVKVEVGDILLNSVLAVSHADRLDAIAPASVSAQLSQQIKKRL
ncbi:hypothetical protein BCR33DRAFT_850384 [Rhizoclosmatium globosum]|uniref:Polynucleotide 5'-hydroxyl-kinase GRC3 n=1 Tax=Rhizoclosmatium globosum TaxID=329046 RepID=A0A1Y2CDK0_9FUNG|nr:hypothetical protein BCR33DRAFT_850384 [Rhizoclosmatium globosum]|eukprot:ORY44894.1 hypothetical protein BCR33DRAFT_850384 [Rhizoclosmatium globosum]